MCNYFWCLAAVEIDDKLATTLLHSMIVLFVTMRGFSFSSAWMELYKQASEKGLQRSKGLRKA